MTNKTIPLSNVMIENFLKCYNTKYFHYDDFINYTNINDVFDNTNFRIIYLPSDHNNVGHWVVMFRRDNNLIEYFDPMGIKPDECNKWLNTQEENKNKTHFNDIISSTPNMKYIYNNSQLQASNSILCGKYVISRIIAMKTKLQDYLNILGNIEDREAFIDQMYTIPVV